MATSVDVERVQDGIEADAETRGWGVVEISRRLDLKQSVFRIIETYWRKRAESYLLVVAISEAGSSRGNDEIYRRMQAIADDYEKRALAEESNLESHIAESSRLRLGSIRMRRV